jgi:hypothetical protein
MIPPEHTACFQQLVDELMPTMSHCGALMICLALTVPGASADEPAAAARSVADDETIRKAAAEWRAQHEQRFRSPTGWLALIGMKWLDDGSNSFGTAADCAIRLPEGTAPAVAGEFLVVAGEVRLRTRPDSGVSVNDKVQAETLLTLEPLADEADCPDRIQIGERLQLQLVRRSGRLAIRIRDAEAQAVREFPGKTWFDIDPAWCITAKYEPYDPPQDQETQNIRGEPITSRHAGQVVFVCDGQEHRLDAQQEADGSLFIVFRDNTSGQLTYGPGRFLDTLPPQDGTVVLDFNRAYSPPCAWSPYTLCPLPPEQNALSIAIEAGEKRRPDK